MDALEDRNGGSTRTLDPKRERALLEELADSKRVLVDWITRGGDASPAGGGDDPRESSLLIAEAYRGRGEREGPHAAVFGRYFEIRTELALANLRLVAHVAKRFRDRGVAYVDLLQEGFCGLLEAIDRFDPSRRTKLSTYATWWIRQSIQSAVAAGAYPVRLSPRHLRELARYEQEREGGGLAASGEGAARAESVQRIRSATRPAVSLDEVHLGAASPPADASGAQAELSERHEAVESWMESLQPRERQVVSCRFGLGGGPPLSLREVGEILHVSRERVRQIQDAAFKSLRSSSFSENLVNTN